MIKLLDGILTDIKIDFTGIGETCDECGFSQIFVQVIRFCYENDWDENDYEFDKKCYVSVFDTMKILSDPEKFESMSVSEFENYFMLALES